MKETIKCALCGLECFTQISASHLRVKHNITTKEYKALGYETLTPSRLAQCRSTPVGNGSIGGSRDQHGEKHWNWKGGHVTRGGYRITYKNGRRDYEHRLVAEETIGRPLTEDEVVHHIDGNRTNNNPSNLKVMLRTEHDKIKDETRAYFHTNNDVVDAAKILKSLGWAKARIERALRVHHATLKSWLEK